MAIQSPLTPEDLVSINQALSDATDAQTLIVRAEAAGIEVAEFKTRAVDAEQRLLRIKQAFFPGQ